jgi:segregation and condensation protein B
MTDTRKRRPAQPDQAPGLQDFHDPPDDTGLSLDQLSEAYSQLLDRGAEPYEESSAMDEESEEAVEPEQSEPPPTTDDDRAAEDRCEVTPRSILEAMLFVGHPSNEPLASTQVASLMRGVRPAEIDDLVRELNAAYDAEGRPYKIESVGAGYSLRLRPQFNSLRDKFFGRVKEARLSQAAIDVLAIVAYNQPLSREQLEKLRGKPSGSILNQLVRRQLLRVERPADNPREARYFTTQRFLDLFALAGLDELPRSQELEKNL